MNIYESILSKTDYLNIMNQIDKIKFITDGKWDWEHGLEHTKRVANYVKEILLQLNADERTIDLGMTTALLHDIGLIKGDKSDHAIESGKRFHEFIADTDITEQEKCVMKQAIEDHSNGNSITSLIGVSLLLADKLDITYHRTVDSSIQDEMNKAIQKIREVSTIINEKELIIKYKTTDDFDIKTLYFWNKVISIPRKAANYLNKECIFMVNNLKVDL